MGRKRGAGMLIEIILNTGQLDSRRRPLLSRCRMNRTSLVAIIVVILGLVALLDFSTPAEVVGSMLFTFRLALCAVQRSKWLLWGTATAAVLLTIASQFWGL